MMVPLRLLLVEDSDDDALLLIRELGTAGFSARYERVFNSRDFISALERGEWDAVVSDYNLPGFGGIEALSLFKEKGPDIPFIIVSGVIGEDAAVEAMKLGAHDYVMKANLKRLAPAIRRELREAVIRRERRQSEQALRESEATYRTLFENGAAAFMFIEEDMTVSLVNKELEMLTGYSRYELEGRKCLEKFIASREDLDRAVSYHSSRLNDPGSVPESAEIRLKDSVGRIKDVILKIAAIPGTKKSLGAFLDITGRKLAEDALKTSLKEKEFLLQELNHRVNNNLQLIMNLLRLQRPYFGDKGVLEVFDESQRRIRAIALVHEKLFLTGSRNTLALRDYISDLARDIIGNFDAHGKRISLSVEIQDIKLDMERVVTCGLIVNELVSNSLKHAFKDLAGGDISINMRPVPGGIIELEYKDNGSGIPISVELDAPESLGMKLIVNLARKQLDGTIEFDMTSGFRFLIRFCAVPADSRTEGSDNGGN